ncbi:MAG: MFS transporter [Caulobacterales bacterium]|nr:MFS transporter [Caulobacterales bacterium]
MTEAARPVSLGRTLAFSATSLPIAAVVLAMTIHLPAYFATSLGMPLSAVGVAFAMCRFIDIPVEPALGLAMDRTRTRIGRYRVWQLAGGPLLMLGLYMLGAAPHGVGQPYLVAWLLVLYLGMSTLLLSHAAWAATLATTYEARARIFGIMGGAGVIGALGVLAVPIVMEKLGYTDAEGVRGMLWYLILLTPLTVGIVAGFTPERIEPAASGQRFRLRDYLELVTHGSMARIIVGDLCLTLGPGWMAALFLFFSRDRMMFTTGQANVLLGVYILAGLFGAPLMGWAATRVGKHRVAIAACLIYSTALVTLIFQPKGNVLAAVPVNFVAGFVGGGFVAIVRAMVADVADDIRLTQGKARAGLLFSLTTSTAKIASVAGTAITYPLLERIGYRPALGHANTPQAIHGLTVAFLAGPIFFLALGALCFVGYKLTAERSAEIRRQLDARDAALAEEQAVAGLGADTGLLGAPRPT